MGSEPLSTHLHQQGVAEGALALLVVRTTVGGSNRLPKRSRSAARPTAFGLSPGGEGLRHAAVPWFPYQQLHHGWEPRHARVLTSRCTEKIQKGTMVRLS